MVRTSVGQPTFTSTMLPLGNGYQFTLRFAQDQARYGATVWVYWDDPAKAAPSVVKYEVTPLAFHVFDPLTSPGKWGLYAYVNEVAAGSLLTGSGMTSLHEAYRSVRGNVIYSWSDPPKFVVTLVKGQPLHVEWRVTAFERPVAGFTSFGTSYSAGTAAIFYIDPTFASDTETLSGSKSLGTLAVVKGGQVYLTGSSMLGLDEGDDRCAPCYSIKFKVQRL